MQTLNRRVGDKLVSVTVVRWWGSSSGIMIGLTPEGDYVTRDGNPVEDVRLFEIVNPVSERKKAEGWWRKRKDREEAIAKGEIPAEPEEQEQQQEQPTSSASRMVTDTLAAMQKNQEEFLARLAGMFAPGAPVSEAQTPSLVAVYTRQKGDAINCTAPKNWDEFGFAEQPEWWGPEAQWTETGEDGVAYTYKRYLVPANQALSEASGGEANGD